MPLFFVGVGSLIVVRTLPVFKTWFLFASAIPFGLALGAVPFARTAQELATRFGDREIYRKSWARRIAIVAFSAAIVIFSSGFIASYFFEVAL